MADENEDTLGWIEAHPDVVFAFEEGIRFGMAHSGRAQRYGDPNHGPWTPDEWRIALKAIVDHIKASNAAHAKAGGK